MFCRKAKNALKKKKELTQDKFEILKTLRCMWIDGERNSKIRKEIFYVRKDIEKRIYLEKQLERIIK